LDGALLALPRAALALARRWRYPEAPYDWRNE
jgi:hypothetical protein